MSYPHDLIKAVRHDGAVAVEARGHVCRVPGDETEVVEVVEVLIIITSNLEPNNQSSSAAAPPELA